VTYTLVTSWPGAFQAEIRIRNTGGVPIDPWTLEFTWPAGQTISQIWNATRTQKGATVTVAPMSWNRLIAPGGSVSIGFLGTGTPTPPTSFTVNRTVCSTG
jgi:cellulase/cellobiase CelA1